MKKFIVFVFVCLSCSTLIAQFPEDFETTVPPLGWATFRGTNGLGTAQDWQVTNISNTGSQAAFVRYENVSGGLAQDWLVTPQFTPTPVTNLLTFWQRQSYTTNYGSVYKVFISTGSQTIHADFTLVDTQTEADFTNYYTERQIDLTAYVGTPIYVAFVLEQDDGDNWLIDDVGLTASPSNNCVPPDNLAATGISQNSATLSWNELGTATSWVFMFGPAGFSPCPPNNLPPYLCGPVINSSSYTINGLTANTSYEFYVQSFCSPGDYSAPSGPYTFTTATAPLIPDYLNPFNPFPGNLWSEASGNLANGPSGTTSGWQSDFWLNTSGDTAAKVNLYFANQNHWLISPDFDLSGGSYELNLEAGVTEWNVTTPSDMGSDDQVDLLI
ncbi:MAG: hypothetical protein CMD01_03610, partial [Flavobacteriales bacterium]|nr:hypothetical protein [Flavobacteriales bacterium]